jgi:hypothetical protein
MSILALQRLLVTFPSIPFVAGFVIAELTSLTLARFLGRLSPSGTNGIEPVEFEVFKCSLVGEKEIAALSNPSSDRFVKVDDGSMGCRGGHRE